MTLFRPQSLKKACVHVILKVRWNHTTSVIQFSRDSAFHSNCYAAFTGVFRLFDLTVHILWWFMSVLNIWEHSISVHYMFISMHFKLLCPAKSATLAWSYWTLRLFNNCFFSDDRKQHGEWISCPFNTRARTFNTWHEPGQRVDSFDLHCQVFYLWVSLSVSFMLSPSFCVSPPFLFASPFLPS